MAQHSRVKADPDTGEVWVDGELDEELKLMPLDTKDLEHAYGIDLEVQIRQALRDVVAEKHNLSDVEKACVGYYLCTIPIRRV